MVPIFVMHSAAWRLGFVMGESMHWRMFVSCDTLCSLSMAVTIGEEMHLRMILGFDILRDFLSGPRDKREI